LENQWAEMSRGFESHALRRFERHPVSAKIRRRKTVARHGQLASPGPISQLLKMLGVALAVVLVSGVSVGAFVVSDLYGTATADAVELEGQKPVPPDISEYEGGFDLLLVGTDTCEEA